MKIFAMEFDTPPADKFCEMLIRSPKIKSFICRKYWMDPPFAEFYLPSCKDFSFMRGDSLDSMKIYAPKVKNVSIYGCYD